MKITKDIVKELINEQYPSWNDLDIKEVEKNGHDNRTFHLGNEMLVRLPSGKHNFYRGGALSVYDEETRGALIKLSKIFPKVILEKLWNEALESKWNKKAVWVHGDITLIFIY